jgi:hypothetical protein
MTDPTVTPDDDTAEEAGELDGAGGTATAVADREKLTPPAPPPWSYRQVPLPSRTLPGAVARGTAIVQPSPTAASFGLNGRRRSPLMLIGLSVATLGIYALVWYARINSEMGDFDTRMHVHPAKSSIPVVFSWLIGLLISIAGAVRIVLAVLNIALPFDPGFTVLQAYILLGGIFVIPYIELVNPFSLVAITMTLERVRIVEDRVGRTTDVQLRPAIAVCWLLVPVIGGLILMAVVQRRLNRVWEMASTPILAERLNRT